MLIAARLIKIFNKFEKKVEKRAQMLALALEKLE